MSKRIFLPLSICTLLLLGAAAFFMWEPLAKSASAPAAASSLPPKEYRVDGLQAVNGMSLEDAGYHINLPPNLIFDGNKIEDYSRIKSYSDNLSRPVLGSYTTVSIYNYFSLDRDILPLPLMCLQAFKKENCSAKYKTMIELDHYNMADLKDYIVYSDKEYNIYNFAPFIVEGSFKDRLQKEVNNWNNDVKEIMNSNGDSLTDTSCSDEIGCIRFEMNFVKLQDYLYLVDIADYYTNNLKKLIVKT